MHDGLSVGRYRWRGPKSWRWGRLGTGEGRRTGELRRDEELTGRHLMMKKGGGQSPCADALQATKCFVQLRVHGEHRRAGCPSAPSVDFIGGGGPRGRAATHNLPVVFVCGPRLGGLEVAEGGERGGVSRRLT